MVRTDTTPTGLAKDGSAAPPVDSVEPQTTDKSGVVVELARARVARIADLGAQPVPSGTTPLNSPLLLLNRETTWLNFNMRVLAEAEDPRTPLLERVKFLAITDSNLDEFFMKRIGGLKQQVGAGVDRLSVDGRTAAQQIDECYALVRSFKTRQRALLGGLARTLKKHGIALPRYGALTPADRTAIRRSFVEDVYPLCTPQAMDPAHPFPFVSNLSINLLITLSHKGDNTPLLARVKVPAGAGVPRLLQVPGKDVYVPLEEVMAANLDLLFPGMIIESCEVFRVTRNANTERDEDQADDLMAMIEMELRDRKFAPVVRLEVADGMSSVHRGMLAAELGLDESDDVFVCMGMMAIRDLMELCSIHAPALKDKPHHPLTEGVLTGDGSIFHALRERRSLLLHHPYDSWVTSVGRFLQEASEDPKVRAIKVTLYRTTEDSGVISHLVNAARNGKQVAVVVELKARFDEDANIRWASRLERVGIHVTYGVVGLKTHCKVILAVRRDYDGLRRYVHIGTGNYHAGTARQYTDLGLLTCDEDIGADATELFNYLTTGYKPKRNYRKLLVAPKALKSALLRLIDGEIDAASNGRQALIQIKTNALEDADVVLALYRASQAGVKIDLIVRDTCRLRPGIPGLSDNVRVISIVGRFLEHARIAYFRGDGDERYYIGSADCMKRNLESRVEVWAPVESAALQAELRAVLDRQLADQRCAWDMHADGSYVQRQPLTPMDRKGSQQQSIEAADREYRDATRLRKRRPRGVGRRNKV